MTIEPYAEPREGVSYNAADVGPVNMGMGNIAPLIASQTETITGNLYAAPRNPDFAATNPTSVSLRTIQLLNELKSGMAQKFRLAPPR